eukprot:2950781-Prymnesium_polylepis.1
MTLHRVLTPDCCATSESAGDGSCAVEARVLYVPGGAPNAHRDAATGVRIPHKAGCGLFGAQTVRALVSRPLR